MMPRIPKIPGPTREVPIRVIIPNILTTIALCCGLASLHFSINSDWDRALVAILASAIFDALDGRAARLLRVTSRFGAVLDSLSDFLSFGVAPAMLLYLWLREDQQHLSVLTVLSLMVFATCSALRLARFTSQLAPPTTAAPKANPALANFFSGMPTPAAAGAVLIPLMIDRSAKFEWRGARDEWIVMALAFAIAWLMISRRPMFAFKKMKINRRFVAPLLGVAGLLVVLIFLQTWITLAGLAAAYLLSLPLSHFAYRRAAADWLTPPSLEPFAATAANAEAGHD